jgi:AmmeMemoRadiSam system protein B
VRAASHDVGEEVPVELVERLVDELDRGLFLEGPRYRDALARVQRAFADADVRAASHAGGAYHDDPRELRRYLDEKCLGAANGDARAKTAGRLVGLVAPHIDPWRGAVNYGFAYGALRHALEAQDADTFFLLGTSHAPMRQPFALCRKSFATPLGDMPADLGAIDALADGARDAGFDPYADQFNHKREHSLEFQAVFLRHLLGERPAQIVPILAGLGEHQARASDPSSDAGVMRFVEGLRALVESRNGRAIVVAGADLAHVGPRFGDAAPDAGQRRALDATDRESLARAVAPDAAAFWDHVARDLDSRRVCGLAPIWSLLRSLPGGAKGELIRYEQTVDKDDGSIVSHAAVGYFA